MIGVTGSPGSGKSSLVDRITANIANRTKPWLSWRWIRAARLQAARVLGDRIRMRTPGTDPGVYIRSMATRGHLGGLATASADVVWFWTRRARPIIVETVGVGQDEIDIVEAC